MNDIQTAVANAVEGAGDNPKAQAAAAAAAAATSAVAAVIPPPSAPADIGFLWKVLVIGLVVILVMIAGGFTIITVIDSTRTDMLVTIFTTAFTGLLGLFIPSPMQKK